MFFPQSKLENIVKLMTNLRNGSLTLFPFLTYQCCHCNFLAAISKNRTRPFTGELFNIVANTHMWQLKFKYKLTLNNIRIQFLSYTRHILNA